MLDSNVSTYIDKDGNVQEVGSGGSEYANTSEIVDISLTTSDDITSLANKILANKTKVSKISAYDSNVVRILGNSPYPTYNSTYISLYFTVLAYNRTILVTCVPSNVDGPTSSAKTTYINNLYAPDGNYYWYSCNWDEVGSAYPVGSIYINAESVPGSYNPAGLFGGTWEQIKDVFLLAAGDTYTAGSTGGSANAVVVSHNHRLEKYGSVLAISVPASESETSAGFVSAPTGEGLWGGVDKAATGIYSTGEDGSGKNMPPYLTVYMWKRIA